MGASPRKEYIVNDEAVIIEQLNKACQTDLTPPFNGVSFINDGITDGKRNATNVASQNEGCIIQRDNELKMTRKEIEFLKIELHSKQATIENLLELLKSNFDVTKAITRGITSNTSDMNDCDNITLVSKSNRNSQVITDRKLDEDLMGQYTVLRTHFDDSLNSHLMSSTNSCYDIFADSLEVNNK